MLWYKKNGFSCNCLFLCHLPFYVNRRNLSSWLLAKMTRMSSWRVEPMLAAESLHFFECDCVFQFLNMDCSSLKILSLSLLLCDFYFCVIKCFFHTGLEHGCASGISVFLPHVFIPPLKWSLSLSFHLHNFWVVLECPWLAVTGFITSIQNSSGLWNPLCPYCVKRMLGIYFIPLGVCLQSTHSE